MTYDIAALQHMYGANFDWVGQSATYTWSEATGAWADHPVAGWGAGSFPLLHHRYRHNTLEVLQPHSVPLQFLAELGLIGAALALAALALLTAAGAQRVVAGARAGRTGIPTGREQRTCCLDSVG